MLYLKSKLCVIIVLYGSRDWIFLQEYLIVLRLCSWFLGMRLFCEIFRYLVLIEYENFTDLSLKCYL